MPVYAPVDGYIWRVKMSYYGYGKGLYVKGDDGGIYVFGHLQRFADSLDRRVKLAQLAQQRYYIELEFPKDSIRVRGGELLAYSGQTGAGAPHLHFEKRTADNFPLDPLTHGFTVSDKTPPVFRKVGFQLVDDRSLFISGQRKEFLAVKATGGRSYVLDTVPYFNRPFAMLVDCFDQIRKDGPRVGIYRLSLYLDDKLQYETLLDTLDYATTNAADLVYDYEAVSDSESFIRRLYHATGNNYAGASRSGGLIGDSSDFSLGLHKVRIEAADAAGNRSQVLFSFLWGPREDVYTKDSLVVVSDSNTVFYFTPCKGFEALQIDSAQVQLNREDEWGIPTTAKVRRLEGGRLKVDVKGSMIEWVVLRLCLYTKSKSLIFEEPFNGVNEQAPSKISVSHELSEQGLIVTVSSKARSAAKARLELWYQGKLLGTEYPARFLTMASYRYVIPPVPQYEHIDRLAAVLNQDTSVRASAEEKTMLMVIGLEDKQDVPVDSMCTISVTKDNVYEPRFIEFRANSVPNRLILRMSSDHYQILPEVILLKAPLKIHMRYTTTLPDSGRTGICLRDKKKDRWVWINDERKDYELYAVMNRGGSFAAVYDFDPPIISDLNLAVGQKVHDLRPRIQFKLEDTTSGIEDDRSIVIKMDGKWMIPEYDPESKICETQPLDPLSEGNHHLAIEVHDRVGNKAQQYLQFMVFRPVSRPIRK